MRQGRRQKEPVDQEGSLRLSAKAPPDVANNDIEQQMIARIASIWERNKEARSSRVTILERAVAALLEGTLSPEAQRAAQRAAHRLAGSLGTLGSYQGSRLAREMEQIFAGPAPLDPAKASPLSNLVVHLYQELERHQIFT